MPRSICRRDCVEDDVSQHGVCTDCRFEWSQLRRCATGLELDLMCIVEFGEDVTDRSPVRNAKLSTASLLL